MNVILLIFLDLIDVFAIFSRLIGTDNKVLLYLNTQLKIFDLPNLMQSQYLHRYEQCGLSVLKDNPSICDRSLLLVAS